MPSKARFVTTCTYCRDWILLGTQVERAWGGIYHASCLAEYRRHREALAASANARPR